VEQRLVNRLAICIRQLKVAGPVHDKDLDEGKQLREKLKDVVADPYSALTGEEREAIVKAVALPTGSWYACPRGQFHFLSNSLLNPAFSGGCKGFTLSVLTNST
jgi:hypothetical protein